MKMLLRSLGLTLMLLGGFGIVTALYHIWKENHDGE